MKHPEQDSDPETSSNHEFFIKQENLLRIKLGTKTLEVRPEDASVDAIKPNDKITFKSSSDSVVVKVKGVRAYPNIETLATSEDLTKIQPGLTRQNAESKWKALYPHHQGRIVIIEIELINHKPQ